MKADIRLIALDLDYTLLNSQKIVSERDREALIRCAAEGIEIVPCTGRVWKGIPDCVKELPGIHYAITINGGKVEDVINHTVIAEKNMPLQTAIRLMEGIKDYNVMYDCYIDGQGYAEGRFLNHLGDYNVPSSLWPMFAMTRAEVPDLTAFMAEKNRPVEKINFNFADLDLRDRVKEELSKRDDIVISASFKTNIEINAPGATKGDAILTLASLLGLDPSQTMGFGDGGNDVSMMKLAGTGVAMGNAMDEVKEAADFVTLTNDEDGVAWAIEKILFDGKD